MDENSDLQAFLDQAVEAGATDAAVIDPGSVVTAIWPRLKCQYGCGGYGSNLCCPPYSPTHTQTRELLDGYRRAILIHCKSGGGDLRPIAADLERSAFLAGFYKAFAFGCGPCHLCDKCNMEHCTNPRQSRPAPEASGIDVYATARSNGFPIEVVTDRSCEQNYYTVVLID
ncbi:DUF2284 domain-containing protein [bacterium]|nr:DUF2284 domain-containing protein [bacterium]